MTTGWLRASPLSRYATHLPIPTKGKDMRVGRSPWFRVKPGERQHDDESWPGLWQMAKWCHGRGLVVPSKRPWSASKTGGCILCLFQKTTPDPSAHGHAVEKQQRQLEISDGSQDGECECDGQWLGSRVEVEGRGLPKTQTCSQASAELSPRKETGSNLDARDRSSRT